MALREIAKPRRYRSLVFSRQSNKEIERKWRDRRSRLEEEEEGNVIWLDANKTSRSRIFTPLYHLSVFLVFSLRSFISATLNNAWDEFGCDNGRGKRSMRGQNKNLRFSKGDYCAMRNSREREKISALTGEFANRRQKRKHHSPLSLVLKGGFF